MKTKIRDILSIGIFLVLIFFAALVIRPAYANLLSKISDYTHKFISDVEEATSLKISYKSLSPSILSAFYIKDVKLTDENDTTVVKIDKVKLEYRLLKLLQGKIDDGFNSLLADGVELNVDAAIPIVKKFITGDKDSDEDGFDFSSFKARLPLDLVIKNVSLVYKIDNFEANVNLKKITAEYSERKSELDVSLNSVVNVLILENTINKSFSGNLNVNGKLYDGFENSTATLTLANLTDGSLKFNKLNLFLSFKDDVLTWATVQNSFPLRLTASYDTLRKDAEVILDANDFSVDSVFASSGRNATVKKFKDLKLSSDTNVSYSVSEKTLSYKSNSSVKLPPAILPGGAVAKLSLKGDEKQISVNELSLQGENYDVSSNLIFVFKNLLLSGLVDVTRVELTNGTVISTEVYFDPLKEGFMAFVPQVFFDEKSFTALQLLVLPNEDSVDFSFEGYDYSHFEVDEPGKLLIDGSYLFSSNYVQTSISLNSIYLDSVVDTAASFIKPELKQTLSTVSGATSDFMFSGDAYLSTDLSSLSFNVPYILLANTQKDNQVLMLSFDGNEQSISLSQADIIWGKQAFHASGSVDKMPNSNDLFFAADFSTDSIPYHFAGTIADGLVRISGDYDTEFEIGFAQDNSVAGYFQFVNFPVSVMDIPLVSSLDANFLYSVENGPEINLQKFEMEEVGDKLPSRPHISISGNATKYGAQFNSITYSDLYSVLDGSADIVVNIFEGVFNSGGISMELKNPLSDEKVSVEANVTNPDQIPLSLESLKKDFYFDSSILANRLSLNRFTRVNSANNEITAAISFMGTLEHPYASVGVEKATVMISGNALTANASIIMEDQDISLTDLTVHFKDMDVNNVSGFFSLDSFAGELNANVDAIVNNETFHAPLHFEIFDAVKDTSKILPSAFTVTASTDGVYGSFMRKNLSCAITAFITPTMISIASSDNIGLYGYYNKTGDFSFQINSGNTAKLNLNGSIEPETRKMNAKLSDVLVDAKAICSYMNLKYVEVYNGLLKGSITFKGTLDNPEFVGAMSIDNPNLTLPIAVPDRMVTDKILVAFYNGEISFPEQKVKIKKSHEAIVGCKMYFDKWSMEHIDVWIRTEGKQTIPVKIDADPIVITGNASGDLGLYIEKGDVEITGSIFADNAELHSKLSKIVSVGESKSTPKMFVNCDIDVALGTHVRMNVEPLIRCVFVPNGSFRVKYDQRSSHVGLEGTLDLKSGDVSYLNRNFYIKEGRIEFESTDENFNPLITARAETREKDADGDNVTIILTAENQPLTSFTPRFSSVPSKSENEIRSLLGQIVVADSTSVSNFMFSAGDYLIQSAVGRKIENSLRDLLNLDILSVRTNVIQNTLNTSLGGINSSNKMDFGNFLDNSTVYIGKYLGSSLYVDAMVHLQYDDKKVGESVKWTDGYSLQPELGFEFASPFSNTMWNDDVLWNFNFRLSVAPDINTMISSQQFVPDTSMSLSWKFSF